MSIEHIPNLAEERKNTKEIVYILSSNTKIKDIIEHPFKNGHLRAQMAFNMLNQLNTEYLTHKEQQTLIDTKNIYRELIKQYKQKEKKEQLIQNPNNELLRITKQKLQIFTTDSIADVHNAIRSLVEQKHILSDALQNNPDVLSHYTQNINIHIQDYILYLSSIGEIPYQNIPQQKDITSYIETNLHINPKEIDISSIIDLFHQQNRKNVYTTIHSIREAVANKTLFSLVEKYDSNGKYLFSYAPLVTINLLHEESIPPLLASKIEQLRINTVDKNGKPVFAKIHEIKRIKKQSKTTIQNNKKEIQEALQSYKDTPKNLSLLTTGKLQIDSERTQEEYQNNIVQGKIGKYFKGKRGVHCAEYVALYLNSKLSLPKGKTIAGNAWTMIENLKAEHVMKEVTARHDPSKYTIFKAPYTATYTTQLKKHYDTIKEAFQTSQLPMVLGVHFLHTSTDHGVWTPHNRSGQGALLHAQSLYAKGNPQVRIRPTANSHVFALEKNFSYTIQAKNQSLSTLLYQIWNSSRHIHAEGSNAQLDMHSPLIADLDVEYTNSNGETVSEKAGDIIQKNKRISGPITIKGLGVSDEIGGSVKKSFFALRMSTYAEGKAMYSFVQAGQISEKNIQEDEKVYTSIMNNIHISYINLTAHRKGDSELYTQLETQYKKYKKIQNIRTLSQKKELEGWFLESKMDSIINQNIQPPIKKYSPLYFSVRSFYAQFFRISKVHAHMRIPVFLSRNDLEKAIAQYDKKLSTQCEHIKTDSGFIEIGKPSTKNAIHSTYDLMKTFLQKAKEFGIHIPPINLSQPAIRKEFFIFLHKIGNFNKNSYFDAVMDESLKYSNLKGEEIFSQFFLYPSKIFFTKHHLQTLATNLQKTKYSIETKKLQNIKTVFTEIPWDILKDKFHYPLSENELYTITNGDAEQMRALILIWLRESGWGKKYLVKKKEHEEYQSGFTGKVMNTIDSLYSQFNSNASAGRWQVKIPTKKPEIKNIEYNFPLVLHKTQNLITQIQHIQNDTSHSYLFDQQEFKNDFQDLQTRFSNISKKKSFSPQDAQLYHSLKSTLVTFYEKYPQAGAIMAIDHIKNIQQSIQTQLNNAKKNNEKITKRQIYDHIINSWSSPVADAQSITVNFLDEFIMKNKLSDVYKVIDAKTKQLEKQKDGIIPNFLPKKIRAFNNEIVGPSEKGKIRIIEMTKAILSFLRSHSKNADLINTEILTSIRDDIEGSTDTEKLETFFKNVEHELQVSEQNPKSKALFLASKVQPLGNDIYIPNTEYFQTLFKALRNTTPEITLDIKPSHIIDTHRKQMTNYIGYGIQRLKKFLNPNKENNSTAINAFLLQKEKELSLENTKLSAKEIIQKLDQILQKYSHKNPHFFIDLHNKQSAKVIQQLLKKLGLYNGIIDGVFGQNSQKALQKISTISYMKGKKLPLTDIQLLVTFYKKQSTKTNIQEKPFQIDIVNTIQTPLNDSFITPSANKMVYFGKIQVEITKIEELEQNHSIHPEKIKNLKQRILQIQLKLLGYYNGSIDGVFGKQSTEAVQHFVEHYPSINTATILSITTLKSINEILLTEGKKENHILPQNE